MSCMAIVSRAVFDLDRSKHPSQLSTQFIEEVTSKYLEIAEGFWTKHIDWLGPSR